MSKTLEEIRRKLQALDSRKNFASGSKDKTTYAHWNIPEGTSSIQRFLPDANQENTFFWSERQLLKFPFPGIKGQDETKSVIVQVPCVKMWDGKNSCPVLNEVRPWWKDDSLKPTASKYWCKRTYFMQGFVKQDPMNETETPENPIRKFIIGPQIFAIIKAALMDPDMENSPVNYVNGTDFIIAKTTKGQHADYTTSKWARKESSLTQAELDAIEQYGLPDLSTYLPKRPTDEHLAAMFEMFEASLAGELYDPSRWAKFYKPFGFDSGTPQDESGEGTRAPARSAPVRTAPVAEAPAQRTSINIPIEDDVEVAEASFAPATQPAEPVTETASASAAPTKSPQEILAMLRNRNKS